MECLNVNGTTYLVCVDKVGVYLVVGERFEAVVLFQAFIFMAEISFELLFCLCIRQVIT